MKDERKPKNFFFPKGRRFLSRLILDEANFFFFGPVNMLKSNEL